MAGLALTPQKKSAPTGRRRRAPPGWPPALLDWYHAHRREMPWRGHPEPYAVWISEIMLQQTRVETVRGYFARFLARFPDVHTLADAPSQDVLKLWEGLGYYSRARHLQQSARMIVAAHAGRLPRLAAELARLPGIGPYTSAAIASICFGEPVPVVDGNVARVFARFLGWTDDFSQPRSRARLAGWLRPFIRDAASAGDFNQALMELGALVCTPRRPACQTCPLRRGCVARHEERQAELPVRSPRQATPLRHTVGVIVRDARNRLLLIRRPEKGLLAGLWELPGGPVTGVPDPALTAENVHSQTGVRLAGVRLAGVLNHTFSHFRQRLHLFTADRSRGSPRARLHGSAAWCRDPSAQPLTTACRRALLMARPAV
jgi:A/G-specific adenine glycosylase